MTSLLKEKSNSKRKVREKFDIVVYYNPPDFSKNSDDTIPSPLRALIVGPSGCGKTTLLCNFIYRDWLPYRKLYVFSKTIDQDIYSDMKCIFEGVEDKIGDNVAYFNNDFEDMITVDDCEPNSLIIFDDCLKENQKEIHRYFMMGRHKNISCIYLTQCYSKADRQFIRNNVNLLCIFKQNNHYLNMIYDDYVGSDFKNFKEFRECCHEVFDEEYGFLTIDLTKKSNNGKFKNKLEKSLKPN